jgi:hypothetical protein
MYNFNTKWFFGPPLFLSEIFIFIKSAFYSAFVILGEVPERKYFQILKFEPFFLSFRQIRTTGNGRRRARPSPQARRSRTVAPRRPFAAARCVSLAFLTPALCSGRGRSTSFLRLVPPRAALALSGLMA